MGFTPIAKTGVQWCYMTTVKSALNEIKANGRTNLLLSMNVKNEMALLPT